MSLNLHVKKIFLTILILLSISACGYKPSSKFSRAVLGEKISTSVIISSQDPENTVIIKDAVDSAIIEVFHASLTDKKYSDSHLVLSINNPTYAPVQYDNDGYVIAYRMSIVLRITRYNKGVRKNYKAHGSYDFTVVPNAVVTDQDRFEAIKFSSQKAIRSFIAQVAAEGSKLKE